MEEAGEGRKVAEAGEAASTSKKRVDGRRKETLEGNPAPVP